MNLLSAIYGSIVRARNQRYDHGRLPVRKLQGAVVSIGHLLLDGNQIPELAGSGNFVRILKVIYLRKSP